MLNVQTNQKIETVESSLNKKIDNMHSEISNKYDNLQSSISRLSNQQQVLEKGKFPSQTLQYPRGMHEIGSASDPNARIDEVKAVLMLRSGTKLRPTVPNPAKKAPIVVEPLEEEQPAGEEVKYSVPPPFPQALRKRKNSVNQTKILEVLRQVKVNIPLLDMIRQVPMYAKFLKDYAR